MRDKLVKLIKKNPYASTPYSLADHLIANGVTIAEDTNVLTNADWIRAMSDEELCDFIMAAPAIPCDEKISAMMKENGCNDCEKCVMDWLRQPAKEEST